MAKATINLSSDHEKNFKEYIKKQLFNEFRYYIGEYGEELAKKLIIENQDDITDNIIYNINKYKKENSTIYLNFKYYYDNENIDDIIFNINREFIKIYREVFKSFEFKIKMEKENTKNIIYNEIVKDVENGNDSLYIKLEKIKTQDYKKLLLQDMIKNYNINVALFNDYYLTIRNKVLREYKDQAEDEKLQEQQQNQVKIPFIWKLYGLTKVCEKINKKIWK